MNLRKTTTSLICVFLAVLFLYPSLPAIAHPLAQNNQPGLTDPAELEAFVDGVITAQQAAYHVAGVTISIVKDGQLFFAKGYGFADVEQRIPVSAEETLFRPGSISKLFIWTSVMQLVEQEKLDLDADINQYLDFEIPATYSQPITLRHLLTHTAGFEDRGLGLFVRTPEEMKSFRESLTTNIPKRVFPPGEVSAYSNYGAGLAAYIVERVSGLSFDEYAETYIFEPLGMDHSTFRQPLPADFVENMSKGYLYSGGAYQEGTFEYVQPYPVGALSSTATDLAVFMMAHLQNGRYGDVQILQEDTALEMHSIQFTHNDLLDGWGQGFSVTHPGGLQAFGHGGDTVYFHSEMIMLPEENVGLYISTNSAGGTFARFNFVQAFLKRYFPVSAPETLTPPADFDQRANLYAGTYYPARLSFTTVEKTLALIQPLTINTTPNGQLQTIGLLGPDPIYWVEVEPLVFSSLGEIVPAGTPLVFEPKEAGSGTEIEYVYFGAQAYIKQPWFRTGGFQFGLLGLSLFTFLAASIALPVRGLVHRSYRRAFPQVVQPTPPAARLGLWTLWIFALLNLIFWLIFAMIMGNINNVIFGLPPIMELLMYVPWISAVLIGGLVVFTILAWLRRYWTITGRIFYTLATIVGIAYIGFLLYWNFL